MSEPDKFSNFFKYWVLPLVAWVALGLLRALLESSGSLAVQIGAPLAVAAVFIAFLLLRRRTEMRRAEAEGRTLPSVWEPSDTRLMDARPAFSNRAYGIAFVSAMAAAMGAMFVIISAWERGTLPGPTGWWVLLGIVFATEVWVFTEYARRVNAGASRSTGMLLRLIMLFAFPQVMVAALFWAVSFETSSSPSWLSTAWFVNGVLVTLGLAGLALWLTQGRPLEVGPHAARGSHSASPPASR